MALYLDCVQGTERRLPSLVVIHVFGLLGSLTSSVHSFLSGIWQTYSIYLLSGWSDA